MKMSFFGKLKNIGPPAPPRRTGNNDDFGWKQHGFWQEDEEEEEENDMYEVPPCERPAVTVPPRQVEENVYMERTSSVVVPQRLATPAASRLGGKIQKPQHAKEKKPPEVDRNEKPGRKKMTPPPAPFLTSTIEEDVYLDPIEEQRDNDDLYLEPAAACPPAPRGPMRMSSSTKMALTHSPMMKPPLPRAKSNSFLPSLTEVKSASGGGRTSNQSANEDKEWFAGDCNRKTAEDLLVRVNKDGTFLIRHSSAQNARQPFTLAVLYRQKVYNIPVRFLEEMQGFALGKEGKKSEQVFTSLEEIVTHHKKNQLYLIDSKSQAKHPVYLSHAARC
ncbi:B-cell linker protein isoform X2 [Syngnathus acus]|uniref:B-cell linker protein isoform X2 n=1 Tax=Syngnathus acus TaxID=161584 RepID=UPI0018861224|nr:B-cell linker protein isoform X2 [Syngnathus acus]